MICICEVWINNMWLCVCCDMFITDKSIWLKWVICKEELCGLVIVGWMSGYE